MQHPLLVRMIPDIVHTFLALCASMHSTHKVHHKPIVHCDVDLAAANQSTLDGTRLVCATVIVRDCGMICDYSDGATC